MKFIKETCIVICIADRIINCQLLQNLASGYKITDKIFKYNYNNVLY